MLQALGTEESKNWQMKCSLFVSSSMSLLKQWTEAESIMLMSRGITIIGDIPIYVAFDSADAWANPELFQFDEECTANSSGRLSAGCFFSYGAALGKPSV